MDSGLQLARPVARPPALPDPPVSLRSLALCLAFMHYCTPMPPKRGPGYLRPGDARRLAGWLGHSPTAVRTLSDDLPLAAHLALLIAAELLAPTAAGLRPTPAAAGWLRRPLAEQMDRLPAAGREPAWAAAAACLGLRRELPIDYRTYFMQSLERQADPTTIHPGPAAAWLSAAPDEWQLRLMPAASPAMMFDLLGLGNFDPPDRLRCGPLTLGARRNRDLGFQRLRHLLEAATDRPMAREQQTQLRAWLARGVAWRLLGPVLVTTRAGYLADLYATGSLRPWLLEQLGPRCALIDRAGLPTLRRWLAARGYPLDVRDETGSGAPLDARAVWLGLRLLTGLQRYASLPLPPPYETQALLEEALGDDETAELEARARQLLAAVDEAIQGRDSFLPAARPADSLLVDRLRRAIANEQTVTLTYEAPGSLEARPHTVEPLRLETRGNLTYLHGYSYRTESNLTFRLDRVTACSAAGGQPENPPTASPACRLLHPDRLGALPPAFHLEPDR